MRQAVDVAVIGGGIGGMRRRLLPRPRRAGRGRDRAPGHRLTRLQGYALGLLNPLSGALIPGRLAAFAREAFDEHLRLWPQFEEQSSIDFQSCMMPHLEVLLDEVRHVPALQGGNGAMERSRGISRPGGLTGRMFTLWTDRIADDVVGAVLLEKTRHGGQSTANEGADGCSRSTGREYCR